jgi:hypothetical protein
LDGFGELVQVEGFRLWSGWVFKWISGGLFHKGVPFILGSLRYFGLSKPSAGLLRRVKIIF